MAERLQHRESTGTTQPSITALFERQAAGTPRATALVDESTTYTYEELNSRANRIARYLRAGGIGPEVLVGCHLSRSAAIVVYILAVLKAGGAYVLLDPQLPAKRLHHMVADTEPALIVTDTAMPAHPSWQTPVRSTTEINAAAALLDGGNLPTMTLPQHAAYFAYTSGSTGRPKAAIITHHATVNHARAFARLFQLRPSDRVPLMAPIAFDVAIEEMIPPLLSGCCLIASDSPQTSMSAFTREIADRGYTILNLPAPLWHLWVDYLHDHGLGLPGSLRLVIVGSDKIYTRKFLDWKEIPGADTVSWVAAYGTTETTVTSTFYLTAWQDDLSGEPYVPIGKPIANTTVHILDENERPVGVGETGQLCIGGHGLARGYHNRPEATRRCFIPDPFAPQPHARLYRTGDLARYRPDGTVVFIGRTDLQVKRNGLRIELGEIEAVLAEHPAIAGAVVRLNDDEDEASKTLVAYVTSKNNQIIDQDALRRFAADRLHPYMTPDTFIQLPVLPIGTSGKINRSVLDARAPAP